jgi:hypothetical protein
MSVNILLMFILQLMLLPPQRCYYVVSSARFAALPGWQWEV